MVTSVATAGIRHSGYTPVGASRSPKRGWRPSALGAVRGTSSFAFSTLTFCYSPLFYRSRLSLQTKLEPHVILGASETLRISFTVLDKDSGKGVVPHQTFLRLYDPATREEGVHPIKVNAGGKGKIDVVCIL